MRWFIMVAATALALAAPGVAQAAAPTNDAFANAAAITSLPASASVDLTEGTLEAGEPPSLCWPVTWDFGDGARATGGGATHRYAADGDYPVTLTGMSPDGRTASSTRTVSVRTHDVAITKLSSSQSARVNQARSITVTVANRRSSETVVVTLYRSRPGGGWDAVGQSTQFVPARSSRTTGFAFSYTFTPEDGAVGKVSFRATASLAGARDALPATTRRSRRRPQ